jgi:CRP-like cAMP-binding protein
MMEQGVYLAKCRSCNRCPLSTLEEKELQALENIIGTISRAKGSIVFEEGDSALECYIICEGEARLIKHLEQGGRLAFKLLKQGDLLGVEELLVKAGSYQSSARVIQDAILKVIPRAEFLHLCESSPGFDLEVTRTLAEQNLALQQKLIDLAQKPACRRLVDELVQLVELHGRARGGTIEITLP